MVRRPPQLAGSMKALGVIPARGGSKSVPRKNLKLLCGQPLIVWSIRSAQAATSLDRLIVSTDDPEIAEVAACHGAEVLIRPPELAADDTPDLPVFQHVLATMASAEGYRPDAVVHLRPTQPLRMAWQIDRAVALWAGTASDCVKSVVAVREHPFKMYRLPSDTVPEHPFKLDRLRPHLQPYLETGRRRRLGPDVPRQLLEPLYLSAGVVDVIRRATLEAGSTEGALITALFIDPAFAVNLDSLADFEIAETLMRQRQAEPRTTLRCRSATIDDADFLFMLANDPEARSNSFQPGPIPYQRHMAWLRDLLRSPDSLVLIFEQPGARDQIGLVRFDLAIEAAQGEVSITTAPSQRQCGHGKAMLGEALRQLWAARGPVRVTARLFAENLASLRLFLACGFTPVQAYRKKDRAVLLLERTP